MMRYYRRAEEQKQREEAQRKADEARRQEEARLKEKEELRKAEFLRQQVGCHPGDRMNRGDGHQYEGLSHCCA